MQKRPLKEVSRGEVHSAWCWIPITLLIRGGEGHGSLGIERRGQEGDVENGEAGHLPGSFYPIKIFNQFLTFPKCLSSKVIWDVLWQAVGSPGATPLASEIHCPPLCCMLASPTGQPSGDPEFSRKNFQKSIWRCILLIFIESKQVEFSPLWLSANKNSPSAYSPIHPTQTRLRFIKSKPRLHLELISNETNILEFLRKCTWRNEISRGNYRVGLQHHFYEKEQHLSFLFKILIYHILSRTGNVVFILPNRMPCLQANRMLD